jgi:hypothetical protein
MLKRVKGKSNGLWILLLIKKAPAAQAGAQKMQGELNVLP